MICTTVGGGPKEGSEKNLVFAKNCEGKRKTKILTTKESRIFFLNFLDFEKEKGKSKSKRQKKFGL